MMRWPSFFPVLMLTLGNAWLPPGGHLWPPHRPHLHHHHHHLQHQDHQGQHNTEKRQRPAILSTLYGYDDCIGGVNNFDTEEEYFQELKRRNCTVVTGPDGKEVTNVVSSIALKTICGLFGTWEWMDGMPVTFNFPMAKIPDKSAFQLELNDGTLTSPVCVMEAPANEDNELDTLLLLGQFGDGMRDIIWPVRLSVIGEVVLSAPEGELDAEGLVFESPLDMRYTHSSVRMVYARMWDVNDFDEGDRYPTWPLPSSSYPNNCQSLFPSTSHIIRVGFSGGVTRDGVTGVTPGQQDVFSLSTILGQQVMYLGLADLGKTMAAEPGQMYKQDGDNYLDVCLDLSSQPEAVEEDLLLNLTCQGGGELYPPKGRPHICVRQEVLLTSEQAFGYFSKAWIYQVETHRQN